MSRRYRLTVEVAATANEAEVAERIEAYLLSAADGLAGRLTVTEYEDHADHRIEVRNRTIRKLGARREA